MSEKDKNQGVSKTLIGIAGALIGAAGVAAWNNREKIKETSLTAKDRAIELKQKTNDLLDTIKDKVTEAKEKSFLERHKDLTDEEMAFLLYGETLVKETEISETNTEGINNHSKEETPIELDTVEMSVEEEKPSN